MRLATKFAMLACIVSGYVISQPLAAHAQQTAAPAAGAAAKSAQTPDPNAPYLNPALPTDQRVNDLISRMTIDEKCSQLVNQARAIPRLKVPSYDWWSEALHGVANNGIATVFPEPVGLAATFDPALIHKMAVVVSTEARVKYNQDQKDGNSQIFQGLTFWSPNINIFRDPRWGRGQETYGEDPYLTAQMGMAFVTGMQGDDPKYLRVVSTPKHFAVHSGPESTRHTVDVKVSKHDEEDTYLPAFRATVVEAKAASVMCVYNSVNGQPGCANDFLLKDTLRGAWNFQGYVVSDCDAIYDIWHGHHYTKTLTEAAADSLKAGVDNDCADFIAKNIDKSDYQRYLDAYNQHLITDADIDTTLRRLFTARMKLGLFDPASMVKYATISESELDSADHRALAHQAARESIVMLKNDGTLPLKSANVTTIAVVGPLADQHRVLEGNYNGTPSHSSSALEGITATFPNAKITFAPGTNFLRLPELVPTSVLTTPDGQPGLQAEAWKGKDFQGDPVMRFVDPQIDYAMERKRRPGDAKMICCATIGDHSIRWTGFITPAESGKYSIGLEGLMDRMWIDDKQIVNDQELHGPQAKMVELQLEKGHKYAVKIEQNLGSGEVVKLMWNRLLEDPQGDAVAAAKSADVVVAVVGITSALEGEEMDVKVPGFSGGDRTSLDLPKDEEDLLKAVKATGKPLVVVLMNGSALSVNWAAANANAILDAWYSGEEGGAAIGETISGDNNPAGRLPVTFYTGVDQLPDFSDYAMKNRTYRYFDGNPLYPFGYGLSYSKFAYSGLKVSTPTLNAGDALGVDVDVKNTSALAGDEVAELYITFPRIPGTPHLALRSFQRVHLDAGAAQHVHFDLSPRDLSFVNEAGDRVISAGTYVINVGGSQPTAKSTTAPAIYTVKGETKLPN
jgi:beta-glucosidase